MVHLTCRAATFIPKGKKSFLGIKDLGFAQPSYGATVHEW
jgi:hypothetical protein